MFKAEDNLIYGAIGLCKVKEIAENDLTGVKREYYVLCPQDATKSVIYVPTDNEKLVSRMREVPTQKALKDMISDTYEDCDWIDNHLNRAQVFREIFTDGNIVNNIRLLRTLHHKKEKLELLNKHLPKSDDYLYKDCAKFLCGVTSFVLSVEQDEALKLIISEK